MTSAAPKSAAAPEPRSLRSFYVCPSEGPASAGHLVTDAADCFEAAILFAERWGPDHEGGELRVDVLDGFSGERCCFTVDLGTGEVGPC